MARHNELGKWGEGLAIDYFGSHGYTIEATNWRMGHHEIDIVARKDGILIVAEVKTRSDRDVDPLEAVDSRKRLAMVRAAEAYMQKFDIAMEVRFDLFAISGTPDDYDFEHVPDAFYPPLKTY